MQLSFSYNNNGNFISKYWRNAINILNVRYNITLILPTDMDANSAIIVPQMLQRLLSK